MRKTLFIIACWCALAIPAFGQGQRFGDNPQVTTSPVSGGQLFAVADAGISFCNSPANAVPCTNKAQTYGHHPRNAMLDKHSGRSCGNQHLRCDR